MSSVLGAMGRARPLARISSIIGILLGLLPFLYLPGFGSFAIIRYAVFGTAALVLGYYALKVLLDDKALAESLVRRLPICAAALYLICYAVVSFTGLDPITSFFATFVRADGFFIHLFLFIFLISAYCALVRGGSSVLRSWLTASVIGAALFSLLNTLSPDGFGVLNWDFLQKARAGATIGNSSFAAVYVVWNIFFVVYLIGTTSDKKERLRFLLATLLILTSPLFVQWRALLGRLEVSGIIGYAGDARAAILAIVIGALIAFSVWLMHDSRKHLRTLGLAAIGAMVLAAVFFGAQLLNTSSKLHQQFIEVAGRNRFLFWESSLIGFKERPLVGYGPSTFTDVYRRHFDPARFAAGESIEVLVDKPHNIFFESLVSGGIVLTLALLFTIGSMLWVLARASKSDRFLGSLLVGGWAAWLFQMQFVFDGITSMVLLALALAIGLAKTATISEHVNHFILSQQRRRLFILGYLLFAVLLFIFAVYLPTKKARLMEVVYNANLPGRTSMWGTLSGISPMGDQYDSELSFNLILNAYTKKVKEFRADDGKLKAVILDELDGINARLAELTRKEGRRAELVFLSAYFQYMRIYISGQFKVADLTRLEQLAKRAVEAGPRDTRAIELNKGIQTMKAGLPATL